MAFYSMLSSTKLIGESSSREVSHSVVLSSKYIRFLIYVAVVCITYVPMLALATPVSLTAAAGEPANHASYVRDGNGRIVETDASYALAIQQAFGVGYSSIDILMQQCFGGGFLNDIAKVNGSHTFASASSWNEPALNVEKLPLTPPTYLDNFTRAWRQDVTQFPGVGMKAHFETARIGDPNATPVIQKDPFSAPTTIKGAEEHPQYQSSGGQADLLPLGNEPGKNQFAIFVAWDKPDTRHAVNIVRMVDTMFLKYGMNSAHMAVLYPNAANLGPFNNAIPPDTAGIGGTVVNADNSLASWTNALTFALPGMAKPAQGDKLFIYNTGHGGNWKNVNLEAITGASAASNVAASSVHYKIPLADGFHADNLVDKPSNNPDASAFLASITDLDINSPDPFANPTDLIQLTFKYRLASNVELTIDGLGLGLIDNLFLYADDPGIFPLDPFYVGPSATYQLHVSHWLLGQFPDAATIDLLNFTDPSALVGVLFRGGDQEFLVTVPEPSTLPLLLLGLLCLFPLFKKDHLPKKGPKLEFALE